MDAIQKVTNKIQEILHSPIKAEYIFGIEGINNTRDSFFRFAYNGGR